MDSQLPAEQLTAQLLRQIARVELEQDAKAVVTAKINAIADWDLLIQQAEKHGLANLLGYHCRRLSVPVPDHARHALLGLQARHRRAAAARRNALQEILNALRQHQIHALVLKGAALENLIYPLSELRPMGDIDLLVAPHQTDQAQKCLFELGFDAEAKKVGFLARHHHLPAATRVDNNIAITVEVHRDALSGDVAESITTTNLVSAAQSFQLDSEPAETLGHCDMLRHLCHHSFEPAAEFKLIGLSDLYSYAAHYHDQIPWQQIKTDYPFVINILSIMHFLAPMPAVLRAHIPIPAAPEPQGVGQSYPPLSMTLALARNENKSMVSIIREIFSAPAWWLHGFYNVSPDRSLIFTRLVAHPLRVVGWILRRYSAKLFG